VAGLGIRQGTSSDLSALVEIDDRAAADPRRASLLATRLSRDACLVAEEHGRVIGFVFWNHTFFECGFVALIVVAASHRRRRVGLRLLCEVEARCARLKLFTSTNASNSAAQALFGRAGFVRSGVIENLDDNDPEVVFFKAVR
jgi:ribosomal protein S18 acetylase RimI-like enzyme